MIALDQVRLDIAADTAGRLIEIYVALYAGAASIPDSPMLDLYAGTLSGLRQIRDLIGTSTAAPVAAPQPAWTPVVHQGGRS